MDTLNEMKHLQTSGFGRPRPRHGLHLLHWFSNNYVTLNNNDEMTVQNTDMVFGVHHFLDKHNFLPNKRFPFYDVGNLSKGAKDLPHYVTEYHTGHDDDSNTDRIIFSLKPGKVLDKIYVTQHDHQRGSFDRQHTHRISKGLIKIIGNLELEDFLEQAGYPYKLIVTMKTLNELKYLKDSGFGRPQPRHGLRLLHWFSHNYVRLNNDEMVIERNPKKRAFGVQRFYDNNLFPDETFYFYKVGNLHVKGAEDLPHDVTEFYNTGKHDDNSNVDRILFSLKPEKVLDKIYVTQHNHDKGAFDPQHAYPISKGLVKFIGNLKLEDFLEQAGYS